MRIRKVNGSSLMVMCFSLVCYEEKSMRGKGTLFFELSIMLEIDWSANVSWGSFNVGGLIKELF